MPANATALSFGLNLFNNGTLTTDDLSMIQPGAAPPRSAQVPPRPPAAPTFVRRVRDDGTAERQTERHKGDEVTTHNAAAQPRRSRAAPAAGPDKNPELGIPPGEVVLAPFVVSPELTRG